MFNVIVGSIDATRVILTGGRWMHSFVEAHSICLSVVTCANSRAIVVTTNAYVYTLSRIFEQRQVGN